MDVEDVINYIEDNKLTAYLLNKETGIAINTINDLIEGKRTPRNATINKLIQFIKEHRRNTLGIEQMKMQLASEPTPIYEKNVSNRELLVAFNQIGSALMENSKALTDLLIKTYDNTTEILNHTTQLDIEQLKKTTLKASNK